jgi:uncharacterized protein YqeY
MTLEQTVVEKMKIAMKAKDKVTLEALRSIKSVIMTAKTEKGGSDTMSEADELKILQRLQKQRKDSLEIYEAQDREDLAKDERDQLAVIESFLPQQMDEETLREYIREVIAKTGATSPKDMGKVMGTASKALAGKADGKAISNMAKELLNS